MNSYLVTGGCGFIGSHLADALVARGDRVRILDDLSSGPRENAPREAELVVGDVTDANLMRRALRGMDGCFHLAAIASVQRSVEARLATHRVNLGGTINVLDAARAQGGVPVVYASSAAVYGNAEVLPLGENGPIAPLTPYGADKAGSELHARAAFATHAQPSTGLRLFNVFGPRQDPLSPYSGVISIFAEGMLARRPLRVFGDGEQSRDFVFVTDVAAAFIAAMDSQSRSARVLNVCRGERVSLLRLVDALERVVGRRAILQHGPERAGDVRHSQGDPSRMRASLGVSPRVGLEEGLALLLDWLDATRILPAASA
jgi:UDP-glucose 4-epimerase